MEKLKIAYVCVHNSCRSQMAEAITKKDYPDLFDAYSGGTETKPQINQDAVRIIKQLHGVDMNVTQHSKLIDDLPPTLDILITMGCNVECPALPTRYREDWGLDDPSGLPDEAFLETERLIRKHLESLVDRIKSDTLFET
ncbi:MAG: arsenate reductase ArsC [Acholeplasmataceae bacterium]|nr:arsenate reductase ArsC [Acholeplasmataceae bacterium]